MTGGSIRKDEWPPVLLAFGVAVLGALPQFLLGALGPLIIRDGSGDLVSIAAAILTMNGVAAASSPLVGALLTAKGVDAGLRTCVAFSVVGAATMALHVPYLGGLVGPSVLFGVSLAMSQPLANSILVTRVAAARRGFAFGMKQAATPAAGLLAGLSLPLVAALLSWRQCFGLLAALGAIGLSTHALRDRRASSPLSPAVSQDAFAGWSPRARAALLAWTGAAAFGSAGFVSTGTYLVSLSTTSGVSLTAAGLLLTLVSATSILGRIGAGLVVDRRGLDPLRMTLVLMLAGGAVTALLPLLRGVPVGFFALAVLMGASGWSWNGLFHYGVTHHFQAHPGRATGVAQVGLFAGAAAGPIGFALASERTSIATAWTGTGTALLIAAALMALGAALRERPIG